MKRITFLLVALTIPCLALGQTSANLNRRPYQPAVAAPSATVYGGGYGYGGGQTAQGAALQGMSQVISAQGDYNLNTSAAAINWTQARSNQMQNQVQGVETFWQMREMGTAARARERGPNLSPEEFARLAKAAGPNPLSARQMDPVSGKIHWPDVLQDPQYDDQRASTEKLCEKWFTYGALGYSDNKELCDTINAMFTTMKDQISSIPPQSYVGAKSFLQTLLYATTKTTL